MSDTMFDPFSKAASEVFKLLLDLDVSMDTPQLVQAINTQKGDDVNILIGVVGDMKGEVAYRFPKETAMEMVKMMSGMEVNEVDEFVTSAMGEVANIISGNALMSLSANEICCDILPPQIVIGDNDSPAVQDQPVLSSCGHTDIGTIGMDLAIKPEDK